MTKSAKSKKEAKPPTSDEALELLKKDPLPPTWIPPPPALGEMLLKAVEYKPLEEKDLFGMKVSKRALKNLSPAEIRDLCEVFQAFSRDSPGFLRPSELYYASRALGFNITEEVCEKFIENETNESQEK